MKIQELAKEASEYLTRDTRNDGKAFVKQTDNAPEWFNTLCREAHGDMLPDDYRYEFIEEALDAIAECEGPADEIQLEADIYTHYLLKWLASRSDRYSFVDDAVADYGVPEPFDTIKVIAWGQLREKEEVLYSVISSLEARLEEIAEETAEEVE